MNFPKQLAEWCANYEHVFPVSAYQQAETAIVDTMGCIFAGIDEPAVISAAKIVKDACSGLSSSIRHSLTISAPWAAMINACSAHALDFDDNFFPAITHASAVLVPALFALGEEIDTTPWEICRAYIVGLEVQAQLGKLLNPGHYELGWHATSTIGTVGAAAACASLMRLDAEGILHAISISTSLAGGSKKQFGTMVKPMHAGFAAMHGVTAAQLASAGLRGNEDILQGKWSFETLFTGVPSTDIFEPSLFPYAQLAIDEYGLVAKLYPSCMSSHLGIDAVLALRDAYRLLPADIVRVDIHLPEFMVSNLRYEEPADDDQSRFSMGFCAAVTVIHGTPRIAHFSYAAMADEQLLTLMRKVHMHERKASTEHLRLPWRGDCLVRIALRDSTVVEHHAIYPTGCNQNRLSETQLHEKFSDCATRVFHTEDADALYARLRNFSSIESMREISAALRGKRTRTLS
jgi:2-methylcitrate dehydratase PrpD